MKGFGPDRGNERMSGSRSHSPDRQLGGAPGSVDGSASSRYRSERSVSTPSRSREVSMSHARIPGALTSVMLLAIACAASGAAQEAR
jgi:hypothetical protein